MVFKPIKSSKQSDFRTIKIIPMAIGQTTVKTIYVQVNNSQSSTALSRVVEPVIHNNKLVTEDKDINPGVNTRS